MRPSSDSSSSRIGGGDRFRSLWEIDKHRRNQKQLYKAETWSRSPLRSVQAKSSNDRLDVSTLAGLTMDIGNSQHDSTTETRSVGWPAIALAFLAESIGTKRTSWIDSTQHTCLVDSVDRFQQNSCYSVNKETKERKWPSER